MLGVSHNIHKINHSVHFPNGKFFFFIGLILSLLTSCSSVNLDKIQTKKTYYVNSVIGKDTNHGLSADFPWRSHTKVETATLNPGDTVLFARGSAWQGGIKINASGEKGQPIIFSNYGKGLLPKFSNPKWSDNTGNAIRLIGDYLIVDGLYFYNVSSPPSGAFETVWSSGAIRVMFGAEHNIIRNCYFDTVPKAVQSLGEFTLITKNTMIGKQVLLGSPYWGPIGIQLGIGNQEVSYNTIKEFWVKDGHAWGADGGAIELDNGHYHKDNIYIHHNRTIDNCGFLEISWKFDIQRRIVRNLRVAFNISTDYQSIGFLEAPLYDSHIDNNTFDRTHQLDYNSTLEVQIGTPLVRNNLFIMKGPPPFSADDGKLHIVLQNNWFYQIGNLKQKNIRKSLAWNANPKLVNLVDGGTSDYHLTKESPLRGVALNLSKEYEKDFEGKQLSEDVAWDVGALQYQ